MRDQDMKMRRLGRWLYGAAGVTGTMAGLFVPFIAYFLLRVGLPNTVAIPLSLLPLVSGVAGLWLLLRGAKGAFVTLAPASLLGTAIVGLLIGSNVHDLASCDFTDRATINTTADARAYAAKLVASDSFLREQSGLSEGALIGTLNCAQHCLVERKYGLSLSPTWHVQFLSVPKALQNWRAEVKFNRCGWQFDP
jgi:hypothetical protein